MNKEHSKEFIELLESIVAKRARTVIDHILKYGFITTEDLKDKYGITTHLEQSEMLKSMGFQLKCLE